MWHQNFANFLSTIAMGKTKPVSKQTFLKCRKNNNTFIRADWLDIFPEPIKFHVTTHIRILHYCNKGLKIVCTFITRIDMDSFRLWKISKVWHLAKQSSLGQEPRMTSNWGGLYSYIRILPHNFFWNWLFLRYVNPNIWIWAPQLITDLRQSLSVRFWQDSYDEIATQLWWDSYSWSATCLIFWTMHISNNIYANKDRENFRFRFPYPLKLIKIRAAMFRKEYLKWGTSHARNHWDKKLCLRTNKVFSTCFKEVTSIDLLGHALDYNHMR